MAVARSCVHIILSWSCVDFHNRFVSSPTKVTTPDPDLTQITHHSPL